MSGGFVDPAAVEAHLAAGPARGLFTPESELALVAALLCHPASCEDLADRVADGSFADPVLGAVWRHGAAALAGGRAVQPALISDAIGADPAFLEWGGFNRLLDLAETGSSTGVNEHAKAVTDRAGRRAIRALTDKIGAAVHDTAAGDHISLLGELEAGAAEIARRGNDAEAFTGAAAMVANAIKSARSRSGRIDFPVGIGSVDAQLGGFNRGELTVLGARTGMGKTVAALQAAKACAVAGYGTCFFSLEMSEGSMGLRLACDIAFDRYAVAYSGETTNPTMDRANKNLLSPDQWARLEEAERVISKWPLLFDCRAGLSVPQIEAAVRRAHRRWERQGVKPGPVFIDHMGKVRPSKERRGNATAELSDVSNDCMAMAKRLDVPVVPLVQLNRQVEGRGDDKRPVLNDIRQSGQIEEDARQIIFLYRPEYYHRAPMEDETFEERAQRLEKLNKVRNQLFWIIEKNSNGPRTQVKTYCDVACSAVRDWEAA